MGNVFEERILSKFAISTDMDYDHAAEIIYVVKVYVDLDDPKNTRYRYYKIDERYHQYAPKNYKGFKDYLSWAKSVSRAMKKYGNSTRDVRNEWALNQ